MKIDTDIDKSIDIKNSNWMDEYIEMDRNIHKSIDI